jgi:hypothetical protein
MRVKNEQRMVGRRGEREDRAVCTVVIAVKVLGL